MTPSLFALMPAAGMSRRMEGDSSSKLLIELATGRPVIIESILRILEARVCNTLVVAVRESDFEGLTELLARYASSLSSLEIELVTGGDTRGESVFNALEAVKERAEYVLVHDAARPCCEREKIREVSKKGIETGAAILAERAVSTVKLAKNDSKEPFILKTLCREEVWLAQTPQVFSRDLLLNAYRKAAEDNFVGTDESSLVERTGVDVTIVSGNQNNIKVTSLNDIALVNSVLVNSLRN